MSKESHEFKTEVRQLLDLMIHSLYSHKEIFLRELISNASDAIDKLRYDLNTDSSLVGPGTEFKVKLTTDSAAGTLTISDNGIGMTREDAIRELGTIARSGTREFLAALKKAQSAETPELIGQFGVGFYSAFMVADRITVTTRRAGQPAESAVRWESSADGSYTIEEATREAQGTDVTLHLKSEDKKYAEEWELRNIIRKYSDYIEHPIVMDVTRPSEENKDLQTTSEETLNTRKALWLRKKGDVSDEEYTQFYRHVSHDFGEPAEVIHFKAEGTSEFSALLFIPSRAPFDIFYKDFKVGPMLYVRRVQIMNNCEQIIPPYLRFVRGVVDSSDLPLNVSREILQSDRQIEVIKKSITKKVLDALRDMKDHRAEKYEAFYLALGRVLREGVHYDHERKETVADLMLMQSTATEAGKHTTFAQYVDRMKPGQEEVYYIVASSREAADRSPYIESFRHKGFEVLIMLDEIDDIIMGSLGAYKGHKLKSVLKGDVTLEAEDKGKKDEEGKKFSRLIDLAKERLKGKVKDVRLSGRLKDSACCLVGEEGGMDHNLEALLKSMGQDVPASMKVLEINASHPVFEAMNAAFEAGRAPEEMNEYVDMLYGQAQLLMGLKPEDPAEFARVMTKLMTEALKHEK